MENKCIVCSKVSKKYYKGKIDSIDVVLCEDHSDYCENCKEVSICDETGKCVLVN